MDQAIEVVKKMIVELEAICPRDYQIDNNYTEIADKIELLNEVIEKLKKHESDVFTIIRWSISDLKEAMLKRNLEPTEEHINSFLQSRSPRTLEEISIHYGWEILDDLLTIENQ